MARFMNKSELVLIVLLILVFDLNGFCDMTTNHVPYKLQFGWITYLLSILFLLFDVYVFHFVITHEPPHELSLSVEKPMTEDKTNNNKEEEEKAKAEAGAKAKQEMSLFNLAEKIVINFIAAAITCIMIFTIYFVAFSEKQGLNSPLKVAILLLPLMGVVCSFLAFANVYLNYY